MSFGNLLPGQGLGFTGSKEIAFGLAPIIEIKIPFQSSGSGYYGGWPKSMNVYDNAYSYTKDDNEIVEILSILFKVIE